jgi:excisionase family DNA binding protein
MISDTSRAFLTTSETAKLFGVTRFTILNWIRGKKLKAAQTVGRRNRILKTDLLRFMNQHCIASLNLPEQFKEFVNCWDYARFNHLSGHECKQCLVFKEKMNRCFLTVHEFGHGKVRCGQDCSDCSYLDVFFPEKKSLIRKTLEEALQNARIDKAGPKRQAAAAKKSFDASFFRAGQYLGTLKKNLTGIKIGQRKK